MSAEERLLSDAELFWAYRRGDMDAFTAIYQRHGHKLYFYARSLASTGDQAEDLVQEAFLRLLRADRPDQAPSFAPFLFTIVRNLALDDRRRAAVRGRTPAAAVPRDAEASADLKMDLAGLVAALDPDEREAVILKAYAGLTFEQISQMTQVKVPTLASRYRSALQSLAEALAERSGA